LRVYIIPRILDNYGAIFATSFMIRIDQISQTFAKSSAAKSSPHAQYIRVG